ncbi:B12-binding domain-containing radical SAM protein [Elusimicrobiota bacterium]
MGKINLVKICSYIPPSDYNDLGTACLNAYLKKHNIDVTVTKLDLSYSGINVNMIFTAHGFLAENWNLPIILNFLGNYHTNKQPLIGIKKTIRQYYNEELIDSELAVKSFKQSYNLLSEKSKPLLKHKYIGFAVDYMNSIFVVLLSIILKKINPSIKIIYGGPQAYLNHDFAKLVLAAGLCDVIVLSEGEETLLKVIKSFDENRQINFGGSMTYDKDKEEFCFKQLRSFPDLNSLPCPDFSGQSKQGMSLPIYASRGCLFSCAFCSFCKQDSRFRPVNPVKITDTINILYKKHNTRIFRFSDNALNISDIWLEELAGRLLKKKMDIRWSAFFTAASPIRNTLAKKLKQAGLTNVVLGAEVFSDRILKLMNKPFRTEDSLRIIDSLVSHNIDVTINIITGFPGESAEDFTLTLETLHQLLKKYKQRIDINTSNFNLYYNSECFKKPGKYNIKIETMDSNDVISDIGPSVNNIPYKFDSSNALALERIYLTEGLIAKMNNIRS